MQFALLPTRQHSCRIRQQLTVIDTLGAVNVNMERRAVFHSSEQFVPLLRSGCLLRKNVRFRFPLCYAICA